MMLGGISEVTIHQGTTNNYGTFEIVGYEGQYPANYTVDQNGTIIDYGGKTFLFGGNFANDGIINNYGIMNNSGVLQNFLTGSEYNSTIDNYGQLVELPGSEFQNQYFVSNNGSIVNEGNFANNGIIVNFCGASYVQERGGMFSGNSTIEECRTVMITQETTNMVRLENFFQTIRMPCSYASRLDR